MKTASFLPAVVLICLLADTYPAIAQLRTQPDTTYGQAWRPQVHFSAKKNWLNDPNGLIFHQGEYHLFYQHNPQGIRWGHMSWGHAVSKDLYRWQELPLAITEELAKDNPADTIMAFSGSCVIDRKNTAGFGKNAMVAIYTGHRKGNQSQYLAYSLDRGRTFTRYAGNPVLDRKQADFRDPNVFWHPGVRRWVMTVVLPQEQRAVIYQSKNLKDWTEVSSFQVRNPALGIWECPALVELEGVYDLVKGRTLKWAFLVSVGNGAPAGGSGMQYFIGDFDGTTFTPQDTITRWIDYGHDFYAAIPFNKPRSNWQDKPVLLGWMSNWQYANDVPTTPFRNAMTYPRQLGLSYLPDSRKYEIQQNPLVICPIDCKDTLTIRSTDPVELSSRVMAFLAGGQTYELSIKASPRNGGVRIHANEAGEATVILYDSTRQQLSVDRSRSGAMVTNPAFASRSVAPVAPLTYATRYSPTYSYRPAPPYIHYAVLVDRSSVEVFTNFGQHAITDLVFPGKDSNGIRFFGDGIYEVQVRRLNSAWE